MDDVTMGERAAARTNKMLNKISGLYVSKTIGYSKDYADSFQRVFGKAKSADGDKRGQIENLRSVDFETGPLGLEIEWSAPPVLLAVASDGAAAKAGLIAGQVVVEINGRDVSESLPEYEIEQLMQQRPLRMKMGDAAEALARSRWDGVRQQGLLQVSGAIKAETCEELVAFLSREFHRSLKSADGHVATVRNWAAPVAMDPVIYKALEEMLRWDGPEEGLGGALASLAGRDSRLWALHAALSMPGAAAGRVSYTNTSGLYTAAIALEDVSYDMGPLHFWPGTNTPLAHEHFEQAPREFLDQREPAAPLLKAGDAVIYDEQTLRCESENRSTTPLPLLFVTFLST
ncbi:unnamed protein product, partial [Symbiodinium sp. KB8]